MGRGWGASHITASRPAAGRSTTKRGYQTAVRYNRAGAMSRPALAAAPGLAAAIALACGPPALVREGRPEGVIVAAPGAKGDEALAATELRDYLAKISGAT